MVQVNIFVILGSLLCFLCAVKNQNQSNHCDQSEEKKSLKEPIKLKKSKLLKARENVSEQVMIGSSFASDWLTEWREVSGSITK